MKRNSYPLVLGPDSSRSRKAAFTLPEMMISLAILSLVVVGVISANLFGLRMFQITENKLTASDSVRKAIGKMTDEIRTCKAAWLGNVSNGVFAAHLDGEQQTGNAVMICATTNATNYILYFANQSDQTFRRTANPPGNTTIVAKTVTNNILFQAQDFSGRVLTNNQNNRVIHFNLEFFQSASTNVVADYYKLETSVTRRALE